MAGYVFDYYKYIKVEENFNKFAKVMYDANSDQAIKERMENTYVTYGDLDRLLVSCVTDFSRFRDVSPQTRAWLGDRQPVLLYELNEDCFIVYKNTVQDNETLREAKPDKTTAGFYIKENDQLVKSNALFLGLTIFQFGHTQKGSGSSTNSYRRNLRTLRDNLRKEIDAIAIKSGISKLSYEVFGILGSNGVAIVWLADQYTDILYLIDEIKRSHSQNKSKKIRFLFANTLFSKNNIDENDEELKKRIDGINGVSLLQLTIKSSLGRNVYDRIFEELGEGILEISSPAKQEDERQVSIEGKTKTAAGEEHGGFLHSTGEYDLSMLVCTRNLYAKFNKGQIFSTETDFYRNHILQTNVKLSRELEYASMQPEAVEGLDSGESNSKEFTELLSKIGDLYRELRELFKTVFPKTAGMVDTLDLLYCDFTAKVSFAPNGMWDKDFSYQFQKILTVLVSTTKEVYRPSADGGRATAIYSAEYLDTVRKLLNDFKQQVFHISESNQLNFQPPKCHLRYTGQSNQILYAYFGIIKAIVELIYNLQTTKEQLEIVPLISADVVPIIYSEPFGGKKDSQNLKIVNINLPEASLYNLPRYAVFLYHELFHYVVPSDADYLNKLRAVPFLAEYLITLTVKLILNEQKLNTREFIDVQKNECRERLREVLREPVYNFVIENYDEIDGYILNAEKTRNKREGGSGAPIDKGEGKDGLSGGYDTSIREYKELLIEYARTTVFKDTPTAHNYLLKYLLELKKQKAALEDELYKNMGIPILDSVKNPGEYENLSPIQEYLMDVWLGFWEKVKLLDSRNVQSFMREMMGGLNISLEDDILPRSVHIHEAYKEISADIPMIDLSGMDIAQYLIFHTMVQKDLLISPDNYDENALIRIGVAIDYLLKPETKAYGYREQMDTFRKEYITLYVAHYFSITDAKDLDMGGKAYYARLVAEAEGWFDKYYKNYKTYYEEYRIYYLVLKKIVELESPKARNKEFFESFIEQYGHMKFDGYCDALKEYAGKIDSFMDSEDFLERITASKTVLNKQLFDLNIELVLEFQTQKNFYQLAAERKKLGKKAYSVGKASRKISDFPKYSVGKRMSDDIWGGVDSSFYVYEHNVNNLYELCSTIKNLSTDLLIRHQQQNINDNSSLWFRGHQRTSYKLIPSIMRNYKEKKVFFGSLERYQRAEFEEFKFRADGSPELGGQNHLSISDYLACMQHYCVPTNFLDWSEDAMTALYFALETYIDPLESKVPAEDAVLYILSPALYNEARNRIVNEALDKITTPDKIVDAIQKTNAATAGYLPNLSLAYNEQIYDMFLIGNEKDYVQKLDKFNENVSLEYGYNSIFIPLAICTSRLNYRIRTQSGMFMAYNLYALPDKGTDYSYLDLEEIQQFYFKNFKESREKGPFLYKIVLKREVCPDLADWLKAMGMSKEKVYPELDNVGLRIKK